MIKLTKMSIFLFALTFLVQIVVSNHMSIKTHELNEVIRQTGEVQNQISAINQEIYLSSAITGMEEKALINGFSYMASTVKSITHPTIASIN